MMDKFYVGLYILKNTTNEMLTSYFKLYFIFHLN
jgi:hypothetical protein